MSSGAFWHQAAKLKMLARCTASAATCLWANTKHAHACGEKRNPLPKWAFGRVQRKVLHVTKTGICKPRTTKQESVACLLPDLPPVSAVWPKMQHRGCFLCCWLNCHYSPQIWAWWKLSETCDPRAHPRTGEKEACLVLCQKLCCTRIVLRILARLVSRSGGSEREAACRDDQPDYS